ncbi:MAG: type III-D CRISPR-associated RAMP protein Csx10 [Ktedonobacteraceae bacterium]
MKQFVVTLETQSPLAIRADHAQGGSATTQYISGTTLLGSLASTHRYMYREQADDFAALFLNGAVQYPNMYPASFKDGGMQEANTPVYPLPKTAQSCKRFSGFKYDVEDDDEAHHGVRDTLIDWALFSMKTVTDSERLQVMQNDRECGVCHSSMDHFSGSGYYSRDEMEPERIFSAKIKTRLQTRTGINRQTGTVQQSILYNREVLEEGMQFRGVAKLPDELAGIFETFLNEVGRDELVRIGTGRTRGMGKVALAIEAIDDGQHTFEDFKNQLQAFDGQVRAQAKRFDITLLERFYVAVTLHSPVIVRDELLRYEGTLSEQTLARWLKVPGDTFEQVYQAASTQRVTGWNELWGTPKANDYAIETGSVFLFSCSSKPDNTFLRALYDLEEQGIGQRRAEGFGRIRISDPFHREVETL